MILSSNINEAIRTVLNFLFFYDEISQAQKSTKSTKSIKAEPTKNTKCKNKQIINLFRLRCFLYIYFYFCSL